MGLNTAACGVCGWHYEDTSETLLRLRVMQLHTVGISGDGKLLDESKLCKSDESVTLNIVKVGQQVLF